VSPSERLTQSAPVEPDSRYGWAGDSSLESAETRWFREDSITASASAAAALSYGWAPAQTEPCECSPSSSVLPESSTEEDCELITDKACDIDDHDDDDDNEVLDVDAAKSDSDGLADDVTVSSVSVGDLAWTSVPLQARKWFKSPPGTGVSTPASGVSHLTASEASTAVSSSAPSLLAQFQVVLFRGESVEACEAARAAVRHELSLLLLAEQERRDLFRDNHFTEQAASKAAESVWEKNDVGCNKDGMCRCASNCRRRMCPFRHPWPPVRPSEEWMRARKNKDRVVRGELTYTNIGIYHVVLG